jgi:hypothetical protein
VPGIRSSRRSRSATTCGLADDRRSLASQQGKEDDRLTLRARSRRSVRQQGREHEEDRTRARRCGAVRYCVRHSPLTAAASGAPIIIRDTITTPIFETGLTDDCRPGMTGTIVGTHVFGFQSVETPQGFHVEATIKDTARIEWSDGSYTVIDSFDHLAGNDVGQGTSVFAEAHTDSGDFFSADGIFQFRATFHEIEHITVTKGDVTRVDFERGHSHFFGDC